MRKKWGPFIGGILIGLVIMAMNYKYVVDDDKLVYKDNLVYEAGVDKPFTGTSESYYTGSKQLKFTSKYKKGKLHGKTIEYYEDGKPSEVVIYKDDVPNGKAIYYYPNGETKIKANYKDGMLNGSYVYYSEDGKTLEKSKYENGIRTGKGESRYESGAVSYVWDIKKGNGVITSFFENGTISEIIPYKNYKIDGKYMSFHENGTLIQSTIYTDGLKNGVDELYYENGNLREKCSYKNDKLEGIFEAYNEDGTLYLRTVYKNGVIISK